VQTATGTAGTPGQCWFGSSSGARRTAPACRSWPARGGGGVQRPVRRRTRRLGTAGSRTAGWPPGWGWTLGHHPSSRFRRPTPSPAVSSTW